MHEKRVKVVKQRENVSSRSINGSSKGWYFKCIHRKQKTSISASVVASTGSIRPEAAMSTCRRADPYPR
jgi:hypothetical protein